MSMELYLITDQIKHEFVSISVAINTFICVSYKIIYMFCCIISSMMELSHRCGRVLASFYVTITLKHV